MSESAKKALLALVLLESLEDERDINTRGRTREWIKRREDKGIFSNLVRELRMEDTRGYREMMRMSHG